MPTTSLLIRFSGIKRQSNVNMWFKHVLIAFRPIPSRFRPFVIIFEYTLLALHWYCINNASRSSKPGKVTASCQHVEEIIIQECISWTDTNWMVLLKQVRQASPTGATFRSTSRSMCGFSLLSIYFRSFFAFYGLEYRWHLMQTTSATSGKMHRVSRRV